MVGGELLVIGNDPHRLSTLSGNLLTLARCVYSLFNSFLIDLWFSLASIMQFVLIIRLPLHR
jgi:hypothetical protein